MRLPVFALALLVALAGAEEGQCNAEGSCTGDVMLQHAVVEKHEESSVSEDEDTYSEEEEETEYGDEKTDEEIAKEEAAAAGVGFYDACEGQFGDKLKECMDNLDAIAFSEPAPEEPQKNTSQHDTDVTDHVHDGDVFDEAVMQPAREIFGIDGVEGSQNQCFVKNQQLTPMNSPDRVHQTLLNDNTANGGTDRGDWAKCLPPPMYTIMSIQGFEEGEIKNKQFSTSMKGATDLYSLLKFAHNEACTHIKLNVSEAKLAKVMSNEINHVEKPEIGPKILAALKDIVSVIVKEYRSTGDDNPTNKRAMEDIEQAIASNNRNAVYNALNQVRNTGLVTPRDVQGTNARDFWRNMYNQARRNNFNGIRQQMAQFKTWWANRPKIENFLEDKLKKQGNAAANGADKIPDVLQNFAYCGQRGRSINEARNDVGTMMKQFNSIEIRLGLNDNGDVVLLNRDGWTTGAALKTKTANKPLRDALPIGDVKYPEGKQTYQDQLFSQGNLACGQRTDGTWTMTTYDRNNNQQNTARATQEEGYVCIWVLDDMQNLPADQRGGFSNTEFIAESPEYMASLLGGKPENYVSFFSKENEKYKYFHCHYAPHNSGAFRVYSFQHQAERNYPGAVRQLCTCDWRKMGMLVSRCDCTLDAQANGGCRRVEMQALNENTQIDLWVNKGAPSSVALAHGDLAEGIVKSYDYQADNRPDAEQIFQAATGRVRATTNGNGGNNVVCATDQNGVPNNGQVRTYVRNGVVATKDSQGRENTFFTDFNNNGNLEPNGGPCDDTSKCREFRVKDINAKDGATTSVPAGGDNLEFIDPKGSPCDPLKMRKDCRAADAGERTGEELTQFLSKFCTTSASQYAVPIDYDKNGKAKKLRTGFPGQQGYLPCLDYPCGNWMNSARTDPKMQAGPMMYPPRVSSARRASSGPDVEGKFKMADENRDKRISRQEFETYVAKMHEAQQAAATAGAADAGNADADVTAPAQDLFVPAHDEEKPKPAKPAKDDKKSAKAEKKPAKAEKAAKGKKVAFLEELHGRSFEDLDLNRDGNLSLSELEEGHRTPELLEIKLSKAAPDLDTPNSNTIRATQQAFAWGGSTKYTVFSVAARNDAKIGLFQRRIGNAQVQQNQFYEIILGKDRNQRVAIQRDNRRKVQVNTPNLLSEREFRDFWVSVDIESGRIAVGHGTEFNSKVIAEWTDTDVPYVPNSIGARTSGGSDGRWKFPALPDPTKGDKKFRDAQLKLRGTWMEDRHAAQGYYKPPPSGAAGANADARPVAERFEAAVGAKTRMVSSAVPARWLDPSQKEFDPISFSFNQNFGSSTTTGAQYAKSVIAANLGRADGVTCLNGKYVWAKKTADKKRPVVSTVREAYNVRGPAADNGQWACRYMGVHCNTNNCNNQAQTEVPDTYVDGNGEALLAKRQSNPRRRRTRRRRRR